MTLNRCINVCLWFKHLHETMFSWMVLLCYLSGFGIAGTIFAWLSTSFMLLAVRYWKSAGVMQWCFSVYSDSRTAFSWQTGGSHLKWSRCISDLHMSFGGNGSEANNTSYSTSIIYSFFLNWFKISTPNKQINKLINK